MILSTIRMVIPTEKHDDALIIIRSLTQQTFDNPDCLCCHIYRDIDDYNVLMIQEQWKSEESFRRHVQSTQYRNLLLAMEISLEPPEVRFDNISSSTGLETVKNMRSPAKCD